MKWKSRLSEYQNVLTDIRRKFLYQLTNLSFVRYSEDVHRTIIDEKQAPNYIATLQNQPKDLLYTLSLDWTYHNVEENKTKLTLPVTLYFRPFATLPVCNNFGAKYSKWKNKKHLQIAANASIVSSSSLVNSVFSSRPITVAKLEYYSYISLIRNAAINDLGNVINDDLILSPDGCRPNAKSSVKIP